MDFSDEKNRYIDRKIDYLDAARGDLISKNVTETAIGTVLSGLLGALSFMISNILIEPAVTLALIGAIIPTLVIYGDADRISELKQIKKQKKHLEAMRKIGVKSNKAIDRKRLAKIEEYENLQEDYIDKSDLWSKLAILFLIVWSISSCAYIFAEEALLACIASITATIVSLKCNYGNNKKILELESSINNLKNNIQLGSVCERKQTGNKVEKTKQQELTKGQGKHYSKGSIDEIAVDRYVENLASVKSVEDIPKTYGLSNKKES